MRLRSLLLTALSVTAASAACAKGRDIFEPVPGAFERTYADSARLVLNAAVRAITDEGIGVTLYDTKRQFVESAQIDIGAVRASTNRDSYAANERTVKFQFRTQPTFGATRLVGEVIYRPIGGGRAMERMVPEDHAGREVLTRMFAHVDEHLRESRADRERRQRDSERAPPGEGTAPRRGTSP